jgi:hypothetical protein
LLGLFAALRYISPGQRLTNKLKVDASPCKPTLKVTAELMPLDEEEAGDEPLVVPLWVDVVPLDPLLGDAPALEEADDWPDELDCERDGSMAPKFGKMSLVMRSKIDRARALAWITSRPAPVART